MNERILPGQRIFVRKEDPQDQPLVEMKVQIVPGDGRVIISPLGDRRHTFITSEEAIIKGEALDGGRFGKFTFLTQRDE